MCLVENESVCLRESVIEIARESESAGVRLRDNERKKETVTMRIVFER